MDFNLLEYEDALEMIPDKDADWFKVNQAFAQGDHWQELSTHLPPIAAVRFA